MFGKKHLFLIAVVCMAFACTAIDNGEEVNPGPESPAEYSFEACCVDEIVCAELSKEDVDVTKSSYTKDKLFKWSTDDKIAMICRNADGMEKLVCLSTSESGTLSVFSAPYESGWEPTGLFFFPYNENLQYISASGTEAAKFKYLIPQRNDRCGKESIVDIPMIGEIAEDGVIEFKHACGALKSRFVNLNPNAKYTLLFVGNRYTYGLFTAEASYGSTFEHSSVYEYFCEPGKYYDPGTFLNETSIIVDFFSDNAGNANVYMILAAVTYNWHRFELYDESGKVVYNSKSQNANIQTANNTIVVMPVVDLKTDELNTNYDHIL